MGTGPGSSRLLVADAHNDLLMAVQHFAVTDVGYFRRVWLPQLRAGGVAVQILPIFIDEESLPELGLRQTLRVLQTAHQMLEACPDALQLCLEPGDIERALESHRIAIVLALEGCPAIGTDLGLFRTLFKLGIRAASLTHFGRNSLADGSAEDETLGRLTRAGVATVALLTELGILVDVSHLSLAGTRHVLDIATAPVIASHSSCRALRDHHRNLPDAELRAIGETGGVIGINLFPLFIGEPASIDGVVDHIAHAMSVAGPDHVGLGPDFTKEVAASVYSGSRQIEGADLNLATPGLEGPADLPKLAGAMTRRGFAPAEVEAVMGGNFRRLLDTAIGQGAVMGGQGAVTAPRGATESGGSTTAGPATNTGSPAAVTDVTAGPAGSLPVGTTSA